MFITLWTSSYGDLWTVGTSNYNCTNQKPDTMTTQEIKNTVKDLKKIGFKKEDIETMRTSPISRGIFEMSCFPISLIEQILYNWDDEKEPEKEDFVIVTHQMLKTYRLRIVKNFSAPLYSTISLVKLIAMYQIPFGQDIYDIGIGEIEEGYKVHYKIR